MRNPLKTLLTPFKRRLVNHLLNNFEFWQEKGVHALPVHFTTPVPDTRELGHTPWLKYSELPGVSMNEVGQIELLNRFTSRYKDEYEGFPRATTSQQHRYFVNNSSFESVDGEILYCMIRHFKPRRIFEIGSGNSTYLSAEAVLKNEEEGHTCELTAFEPYPSDVLKAGFAGLTRLEQTKAQNIPLERFEQLSTNDVLFIDSTHVLKIGSDVQFLYLEVLPRLNPGVLVHVHDIFLPAEYPREWVMKQSTFYNEQYLLQAFLAFNENFQVNWAGSFMHVYHPEKLESAFSSYDRRSCWPGSFWFRRLS